MGTPDRFAGPSIEEETQYEDRTADGNPTIDGAVRRIGDDLVFKTSTGVVSLLAGSSGITPATHKALDQLVHGIAEDSFTEYERTGARVDAIRTYTDGTKTTKIREQDFTYTAGQVTQIVTRQYDGAGVLAETYTETLSYTGSQVDDITGVLA